MDLRRCTRSVSISKALAHNACAREAPRTVHCACEAGLSAIDRNPVRGASVERRCRIRAAPARLAGRLFDEQGPSHGAAAGRPRVDARKSDVEELGISTRFESDQPP
jgi:hypothetical protein